jgi:hypothetical protein
MLLVFVSLTTYGQEPVNVTNPNHFLLSAPYQATSIFNGRRKLYQRNIGAVIGLQRGKYTSLELGGEAHWRKISLLKPHIVGATANLSYNPGRNILGYHAGVWMKRGHINLTYGADINYFTDFNNRQAIAIGPSAGFRLFGFHLVNGFNFIARNSSKSVEAPLPVNTLYMTLRYYIPVKNEFTWDRQTMKKKRARRKARITRQRERKNQNGNKSTSSKKKWHFSLPFSKSR